MFKKLAKCIREYKKPTFITLFFIILEVVIEVFIPFTKASAGFAKNLRHDMFEKIQGFSFENIDKFSSSSLVTRMTTDVSHVQMSYMMIIRTAIRSLMMFVFSVFMTICNE